jgi:hypothetical protein
MVAGENDDENRAGSVIAQAMSFAVGSLQHKVGSRGPNGQNGMRLSRDGSHRNKKQNEDFQHVSQPLSSPVAQGRGRPFVCATVSSIRTKRGIVPNYSLVCTLMGVNWQEYSLEAQNSGTARKESLNAIAAG